MNNADAPQGHALLRTMLFAANRLEQKGCQNPRSLEESRVLENSGGDTPTGLLIAVPGRARCQWTPNNSTSNTNAALGGMAPPAPRAP